MTIMMSSPTSYPSYKVWGGQKLAELKSLPMQDDKGRPLGEVWELSTLEGQSSFSKESQPPKQLDFLFKLIDTQDNLSVQVHPDEDYAQRVESTKGKDECWLILDAQKDAQIYLGFREGITQKDLEHAINQGEDVSQLLKSHKAQKGDFYIIPAGCVHALGTGLTLAEVQKPSGVTYRLWDWNRVDKDGRPRELHLQKAYDVLKYNDESIRFQDVYKKPGVLWENNDFRVVLHRLAKNDNLNWKKTSKGLGLYMIQGELELASQEESFNLSESCSLYLHPHQSEDLTFSVGKGSEEILCLAIES